MTKCGNSLRVMNIYKAAGLIGVQSGFTEKKILCYLKSKKGSLANKCGLLKYYFRGMDAHTTRL